MDYAELSPEAAELLKVIESTYSEEERKENIIKFATSGTAVSCRILMEIYQRCLWRETRFTVLYALGLTGDPRAVEFLTAVVREDPDDFPLIAESLTALGMTGSSVACEFLRGVMEQPGHPLKKTALRAMDHFADFSGQSILESAIYGQQSSPSLVQLAVLTLGKRSFVSSRETLEKIVKDGADPALLNAAILSLGRIGNSASTVVLNSLDTRHRYFVEEIRRYATERILLRSYSSPDKVVDDLLKAENTDVFLQKAGILREFDHSKVWAACSSRFGKASANQEGMIRAVLWQPEYEKDAIEFIVKHHSSLDRRVLASLIWSYRASGSGMMMSGLWEKLPLNAMLTVCQYVRDPDLVQRVEAMVKEGVVHSGDWIPAVNALVMQTAMSFVEGEEKEKTEEILLNIFNSEREQKVRERALRALGQIRSRSEKLEAALVAFIEKGKPEPSFLFVLERVRSRKLEEALINRLVAEAESGQRVKNFSWILRCLSFYPRLFLVHKLPDLGLFDRYRDSTGISLLTILSRHSIRGGVRIIRAYLKESVYQEKILAIVAARYNFNDEIWDLLFSLLDDANVSISGRALDSILVGGKSGQHLRLLQWYAGSKQEKEIFMKIVRSLSPVRSEDYSQVVTFIDQMIDSGTETFSSYEVRTAAIGLRDTLETSYCQHSGHNDKSMPEGTGHRLDKFLRNEISSYTSYSGVIKAVLRNAELTWQYPELFDHLVDKSTMVIEYTKSIDLLLQESIGGKIFNFSEDKTFQAAQSHLMRMDLESYQKGDLIQKLQCTGSFNLENFPYHKLMTVNRAVLNGKIRKDQFRILDGLRSWSVLLLLFGRNLTVGGHHYPPVIPVRKDHGQSVLEIAYQLNYLQEIRNRAAHRGTLFKKDQLEMVREYSFSLLKSFEKLFSSR